MIAQTTFFESDFAELTQILRHSSMIIDREGFITAIPHATNAIVNALSQVKDKELYTQLFSLFNDKALFSNTQRQAVIKSAAANKKEFEVGSNIASVKVSKISSKKLSEDQYYISEIASMWQNSSTEVAQIKLPFIASAFNGLAEITIVQALWNIEHALDNDLLRSDEISVFLYDINGNEIVIKETTVPISVILPMTKSADSLTCAYMDTVSQVWQRLECSDLYGSSSMSCCSVRANTQFALMEENIITLYEEEINSHTTVSVAISSSMFATLFVSFAMIFVQKKFFSKKEEEETYQSRAATIQDSAQKKLEDIDVSVDVT
jgi:hypothetical protein